MTAGPSTRSTSTDAVAFLLETVGKVLKADRSGEIAETVETVVTAKHVFVYGVGRSGLVARAFAMRLVQLGIDCYFIGETITPVVGDGDVVLIVSNTGATMSAIQVANIARRVGAKVVTVTGVRGSKLSHASNPVLLLQTNGGADQARLAPLGTVFEDACLILLDAIVAEVLGRLAQTEGDMRARHAIMV